MELILDNLIKTFSDVSGRTTFTLTVSNLTLSMGRVHYVMGRNGSGKSVLMRLISGETKPDRGVVQLRIRDIGPSSCPVTARIVRQEADQSLACELSVAENVTLHIQKRSWFSWVAPIWASRPQVLEALSLVPELLSKTEEPAGHLSLGQRQKLAFVCATVARSPLLLLDEFLAAADEVTAQQLRRATKQFVAETLACAIVVSHSIQAALEDADTITVLADGTVRYHFAQNALPTAAELRNAIFEPPVEVQAG